MRSEKPTKETGFRYDLKTLGQDENPFDSSISKSESEGVRDEYRGEHEDFNDNK